jgi:hypothetical protein
MARSNLVNAVDVALAADVAGADPTIQVTDPALLPAVPFYLVIDPFGDSSREYLRATSLATDVLSVERDLDGSQSTTHSAGDIVRISYVAQHLSDLWDNFGSYLPLSGGVHMTGGIHFDYPASNGYATLAMSSGDDRRVAQITVRNEDGSEHVQFNLYAPDDPGFSGGGFTFVGPGVTLFKVDPTTAQLWADLRMNDRKVRAMADPTDAKDAATKGYVDAIPVFSGLHADLTDVTADQHHTRYTDAEAVAAVGTPWTGYLPLGGGTMTGSINMGSFDILNIPRIYTDPAKTFEVFGPTGNRRFQINSVNPDMAFSADDGSLAMLWSDAGKAWDLYGNTNVSGTLSQNAGGRVRAAPLYGVIQRWNGDGDADTYRYYEWRRGDWGWLELFAIESSIPTMALRIGGNGSVTLGKLAAGVEFENPADINQKVVNHLTAGNTQAPPWIVISGNPPTGDNVGNGCVWFQL